MVTRATCEDAYLFRLLLERLSLFRKGKSATVGGNSSNPRPESLTSMREVSGPKHKVREGESDGRGPDTWICMAEVRRFGC